MFSLISSPPPQLWLYRLILHMTIAVGHLDHIYTCTYSFPLYPHILPPHTPSSLTYSFPFTYSSPSHTFPPSSHRIVGYDQGLCEQPWTVSLTLRLLVSVPPILFTLISLIFLHLYPITEERRERTKRELKKRRYHYSLIPRPEWKEGLGMRLSVSCHFSSQ